jgi:hypothetical protein
MKLNLTRMFEKPEQLITGDSILLLVVVPEPQRQVPPPAS